MNKLVSDIISDVRLAIDEVGVNDSEFLSETDEAQLDDLISGKLCEAVDWVHSSAALELMSGDAFTYASVPSTGSKDVDVTDMIRFVQGKGYGWKNAVRELTEEGTAEYTIAFDEYVGASVDRPVVLLEFVMGKKMLKLLPMDAENPGSVVYVKRSEISIPETELGDDEEMVNVDSNLYSAMVNYLGGLVLMTLNDDRGENMVQVAKSMVGLEKGES